MGYDTVLVAEYLDENPYTIDEQIAEDLDLDIKIIRNSLYKLHQEKLADFRKKPNFQTGYFSYYWKVDLSKIKSLMDRRRNKVISLLQYRINGEM